MADTGQMPSLNPGIYNIDYFSGSQVAVYIGSILIDEITSMSFSVQQNKTPIFGYTDTYFRTVSKGQVIVQGTFTINFKEAGYLWLALNEYHRLAGTSTPLNPIEDSSYATRKNVEKIVQNDDKEDKYFFRERLEATKSLGALQWTNEQSRDSLTGFPGGRSSKGDNLGTAESLFEQFEDAVWGNPFDTPGYDELHRRADEPALNGFDIYLTFGDYIGDNRLNHTVRKITNVHIIGTGQEIVVNGMPIQEQYSFFARNVI